MIIHTLSFASHSRHVSVEVICWWYVVVISWGIYSDSEIYGANMGPTWVLQAPGGPHVGPINPAIRVSMYQRNRSTSETRARFIYLARKGLSNERHYDDVIMGTIASQITSLAIVYSTVYSGADQSKHQSSASLAFVWGIHRGPVNSPHKWPVTRKMFPFDDVIIEDVTQITSSLGWSRGLDQSWIENGFRYITINIPSMQAELSYHMHIPTFNCFSQIGHCVNGGIERITMLMT